MYVVLLALLYILMMMVITSDSIFKGIMVLIVGGSLIALVVYLLDTPRRAQSRRMADMSYESDQADSSKDE